MLKSSRQDNKPTLYPIVWSIVQNWSPDILFIGTWDLADNLLISHHQTRKMTLLVVNLIKCVFIFKC